MPRRSVDRRADIRNKALKDLQESEVLMIDGHFDYGNGYHGRVYLNPHQLFRHPVDDLALRAGSHRRPAGRARAAHRSRGRAGHRRRAARAHHRRAARQPPQPDASALQLRAVQLRPGRRARRCGRSIAPSSQGKRVLLADDVRNTGETFARGAALAREAGATVLATVEIYDRLRGDHGSRRAESSRSPSTRRRRTTRPASVRCARTGVPITRF